jgi:hypothetical protein
MVTEQGRHSSIGREFVIAEVLISHPLVDCGRRSVLRREAWPTPYRLHEQDGNTTAVPSLASSASRNSSAFSDSLRFAIEPPANDAQLIMGIEKANAPPAHR